MAKFLYKTGQTVKLNKDVKLKKAGETGVVEGCDTDPTMGTPFYRVRFDDRTTYNVAESDLWPGAQS